MTLLEDLKRNFYKEGTTRIDKRSVLSSCIVFFLLICFAIYKSYDLDEKAKDRNLNKFYTIGITGSIKKNIKSSKPVVYYYYQVADSKLKGTEHIDKQYEGNVIAEGGRYYVLFSKINPDNSELLLGFPVPDSVKIIPKEGLKYMPGYQSLK